MKPLRIFLFISVFLFLFSPISAFEDTFQYYIGGDYSDEWFTAEYVDTPARDVYHEIALKGGTFSRTFYIGIESDAATNSEYVQMWHYTSSESNYWSVTFRDLYTQYYITSDDPVMKLNVLFYDADGSLLMTHSFYADGITTPYYGTSGCFEYLRDSSSGLVNLRVNGVNKGTVGTASNEMAYISFKINQGDVNTAVVETSYMYIDDVTTTGDIVGVCSESVTHTITESNLNPTNISYSLNTFPFATYTSTEYEINVKRYNAGVLTSVASEVIKATGNSSVFTGFSNYNRSADLTNDDTAYGLYTVYLTGDGTSKDIDYFFFAPPGDTSSISFSNYNIPIGTTETISYSIDAADFGSYSYHVRVYSTTKQIQSTQVSKTSSTVSWDTTDVDVGLHYAVLSRTDKSSGAYIELIYDIAILSNDIVIRGHIYDAQNETVLDNVSVNFSQASAWYNTTSNTTGYYELSGLIATVDINVNASLVNYTHENFTFTPLTAEIYTVDLYLINNTPTYDNTTIGGLTYDYPLHQAVINSTVNIYNATWSNTTTSSSITGFYLFEELTNGSYDVNATKTGYQDSDEYSVDTNNGSWETQNILMYGIYDLTIRAQDATTNGYITSFSVDYGGIISSTTNGTLTYSGLTYGLYTFSVSATGYYSNSEDILVDSTKTETIQLTQTTSPYYDPEHNVKFTVWGLTGYYVNIDVLVYKYGESSTTYSAITGTDGSVTFDMEETQRYRVTFINATQGIDKEMILYPVEISYLVFISSTSPWDEYAIPISTAINIDVTTEIINSTAAYVNITYTDTLQQTTAAIVYLNQTNNSDPYNQTVIGSQSGLSGNWTHSFIVNPYKGESYYVHVIATHTTYGTIDKTYAVSFDDNIIFDGIPSKFFLYLSIFIMVFTGAMFGATSVGQGSMIICIEGWVFLAFGWFSSIDSGLIMVGLGFATVFSLIYLINQKTKKEGVE